MDEEMALESNDPSSSEEILSTLAGILKKAEQNGTGGTLDAILKVFGATVAWSSDQESDLARSKPSSYFQMAVEALENAPEPHKTSTMLALRLEIAKALAVLGEWDEAVTCLEDVCTAARDAAEKKLEAEALREVGRIERRRERWEEALERYRQSETICEEIGDGVGMASAVNCIGAVYFEKGEMEKARTEFEDALKIALDLENRKLIAQLNNNLAAIADVRGDHQKAISLYEKALLAFQEMDDARGSAEVYNNMGMSYAVIKELKKAGRCYEKSLEISLRAGDLELLSDLYLNKSDLCLTMNQWSPAKIYAVKALEAFTSMGDRLGVAEAHKLLGIVADHDEKWELSKSHFSNSVRINRECGCLLNLAEACRDFGCACLRRGESEEGKKLLKSSHEIFKQLEARDEERDVADCLARIDEGGANCD
jgi:tetratricopeptide (TPR) repeat protein